MKNLLSRASLQARRQPSNKLTFYRLFYKTFRIDSSQCASQLSTCWPVDRPTFIEELEAAPTTLLFFSLLALLWARRKTGTKQWYLLFLLASILTAWAYGEIRLTDVPDENNLRMPPREARLEIIIHRIYTEHDLYGKTSGLATVQVAPWESRLKAGDRIYFRLSKRSCP